MSGGRLGFMDRIRSALDRPKHPSLGAPVLFPESPGEADQMRLTRWENRTRQAREALLDRLTESSRAVALNVMAADDPAAIGRAVTALVDEKTPEWGKEKIVAAWLHPLVDRLGLDAPLADRGIPLIRPDTDRQPLRPPAEEGRGHRLKHRVAGAFIGVTSADFCIADSATLVMKTRPGHPRMISLLPTIHVAVIRQSQILSDLPELYALLRWHPDHQGLSTCMTFVTGPSKTADIEATLVHGAHGPREVHLFVYRD